MCERQGFDHKPIAHSDFFLAVNCISLILCERQGLTINQLRGGCRGACKVPGAPEPPQATAGRVRLWETGESQVNPHSAAHCVGVLGS